MQIDGKKTSRVTESHDIDAFLEEQLLPTEALSKISAVALTMDMGDVGVRFPAGIMAQNETNVLSKLYTSYRITKYHFFNRMVCLFLFG